MSLGKEQGTYPITMRELSTFEEYQECVEIQKETWGDEFEEWVPTSILKVSQKIGGIVAGAFDRNNRMTGFVYGLTGIKDGRPVHWSHMLAVRNDARGSGIGKQLKLYQRDLLLRHGVPVIYWTFDPLVARNANLNINGLGAVANEYVKDMYMESRSVLHQGMSMDRFIVLWQLDGDRVSKALAHQPTFAKDQYLHATIANTQLAGDGTVSPTELPLPREQIVRIEVPFDIEAVKSISLSLAREWRANTRRAFLWYQEQEYVVDGFYIEPDSHRSFYCLTQQKKA